MAELPPEMKEKIEETRKAGRADFPLGNMGTMRLDVLLEFINDVFPTVPHDKIGVQVAGEVLSLVLALDTKIRPN